MGKFYLEVGAPTGRSSNLPLAVLPIGVPGLPGSTKFSQSTQCSHGMELLVLVGLVLDRFPVLFSGRRKTVRTI